MYFSNIDFPTKTDINELIKAFEKLGTVIHYFVSPNNNYAIIQFKYEYLAKQALTMKVHIDGQNLTIKPKITNDKDNKLPYFQKTGISNVQDEHLKSLLKKNENDFNQQICVFINSLQLPLAVMVSKYSQVCHDLQVVLAEKFPGCMAHAFGSTVTGLAFKKSDLDVFIQLEGYETFMTQTVASQTTVVAKKLMYKSSMFKKILAIPKAKTPIVKCIHVKTNVSCDFNFKSMLGVYNSQLIKFLLKNDINFSTTMIILKYWAQRHGVTGTGKMTNYCLSLLFIFFLQQKPNCMLPPIHWLQTSESINYIEGWNAGFSTNTNLFPAYNKCTVQEILLDFFKYYSKFDFGLWVVSPFIGQRIPKIDFLNDEFLPPELDSYRHRLATDSNEKPFRIDLPMSVQDPFILNHNITGNVNQKVVKEFQILCQNSAEIVTTHLITPGKILNNLLVTLSPLKIESFEILSDTTCIFKVPYNSDLHLVKIDTNDKVQALIKLFFEKFSEFVIATLTKIYRLNISPKHEELIKKSIRLEGKSDVHDDDIIDIITYHCIGRLNVWDGRRGYLKGFEATNPNVTTAFEKEEKLTEYVGEVIFKGITFDEDLLKFDLSIISKKNPVEVKIEINNDNSKCYFKSICLSLSMVLPSLFEKYIRDLYGLSTTPKIHVTSTGTSNEENKDEKTN